MLMKLPGLRCLMRARSRSRIRKILLHDWQGGDFGRRQLCMWDALYADMQYYDDDSEYHGLPY